MVWAPHLNLTFICDMSVLVHSHKLEDASKLWNRSIRMGKISVAQTGGIYKTMETWYYKSK